ncbi:MAG: type II toxin-antitoxin system HicB family antitoxin [Bacteroidetes bacterium]|nr:type II toxin-antitoxin system HicB family antitoxin [Bacteroidota bacterium]MBU2585123.1 type II toxin-antitoxin system HicB family antitoxin [Bacteroidota bacterium]
MKYYYAIFRKTYNSVEVEFPDLKGCVTFGDDWDEAVENATDVLVGWLANAESNDIKEPSSFEELQKEFTKENIIPIPIDENILDSYRGLKKVDVTLSNDMLTKIDKLSNKKGIKRSLLLKEATEEYLKKYGAN